MAQSPSRLLKVSRMTARASLTSSPNAGVVVEAGEKPIGLHYTIYLLELPVQLVGSYTTSGGDAASHSLTPADQKGGRARLCLDNNLHPHIPYVFKEPLILDNRDESYKHPQTDEAQQ